MSAAERIEWWSDHPVLLWCPHPCDEIWDAFDLDFAEPANNNSQSAVALAPNASEQPPRAAPSNKLSHLPLARGATASTRQGRGDAFRSEARTSVGRGLPPDLYRATRIKYEYAAGDDDWTSPFEADIDGSAANDDERRAKPSPHVEFQRRILEQTFEYDWVGNNRKTGDNENGFYDRSLGAIDDNDEAGKPYQLRGAALAGGTGGSLQARYDAAGYMTKMQLARSGPCIGGRGDAHAARARLLPLTAPSAS